MTQIPATKHGGSPSFKAFWCWPHSSSAPFKPVRRQFSLPPPWPWWRPPLIACPLAGDLIFPTVSRFQTRVSSWEVDGTWWNTTEILKLFQVLKADGGLMEISDRFVTLSCRKTQVLPGVCLSHPTSPFQMDVLLRSSQLGRWAKTLDTWMWVKMEDLGDHRC